MKSNQDNIYNLDNKAAKAAEILDALNEIKKANADKNN
jgi:hypothetical protein